MDFSNLVKGQNLDVECPNCGKNVTFDASLAFKSNTSITCDHCESLINLDTADARKEAEKIEKQLKNLFK